MAFVKHPTIKVFFKESVPELFAKAMAGMKKQNWQQSIFDHQCLYGDEEIRCPVGHLLSLETCRELDAQEGMWIADNFVENEGDVAYFLHDLQYAHDTVEEKAGAEAMKESFRDLAKKYNLDASIIS